MKSYLFKNRVRTGPGKPGKSWNFTISFSRPEKSWNFTMLFYRPGKSWNLSVGDGKSWKMNKIDFF